MARMLRERTQAHSFYPWLCVVVVLYFVWRFYPNTVSGGNGLPLFVNGGTWEDSREMIFFPEGTKYNVKGDPIIPNSHRSDELDVMRSFLNCIHTLVLTIICGFWTIVAVICYKILYL